MNSTYIQCFRFSGSTACFLQYPDILCIYIGYNSQYHVSIQSAYIAALCSTGPILCAQVQLLPDEIGDQLLRSLLELCEDGVTVRDLISL